MIRINGIKMKPGFSEKNLEQKIYKILRIKSCNSWKILKKSLDSRKHDFIHYEISVGVYVSNEDEIIRTINNKNIMLTNEVKYTFPHIINTELREFLDIDQSFRPVIIGSGPAGYHAAVKLAYAGFKPIVLERGKAVEERVKDIDKLWASNKLNEESNICFGEGGAGTFSDGKLNTGNKDKGGYFKEVLETFVRYGADPSILYDAKPHIGTDVLRSILKNMREDIIRLGGEVRFNNKLIDIDKAENTDSNRQQDIYDLTVENTVSSEVSHLFTRSVILAIGHSSRDTYRMLISKGFDMEPKPFALGVRVEHKAECINEAMYGREYKTKYGDTLPAADYKLVYHTNSGRSVFSFCMCPGGYVVNSSTENECVCINGMSYSGRDGNNSNSAIIVNIDPSDFLTDGFSNSNEDKIGNPDYLLSGIEFQRQIERLAFSEGAGCIPVQLYGDFKDNKVSSELKDITPEIKGKWNFGDLRKVLPEFVTDSILEAMPEFGKKINGYDSDDTVMSAVEARSSSPVRILRNDKLLCQKFPGIIPSGEGAGYAGGITSAAADGIKAAEAASEYIIEDLIDAYKVYEEGLYKNC